MAENKQNTETDQTNQMATDKTTNTSGGAASTKQAKEGSRPDNTAPKQNEPAAKDTLSQAKEATANVANQVAGQAKEKAVSVIDEQKTNLASGINTVADSIRHIGENLSGDNENNQIASLVGKYGDTLAGQVEKFSSYIEDRELKELARDVETFARRNPALFIGGAFALGILAARFLKSSDSNRTAGNRSRKS